MNSLENYEEFIKLLKESIEESECNQCQQLEKTEYDPDIIFDSLMNDSIQRIEWMKEWHGEFRHDMVKRHAISLGENLIKLFGILKEEYNG